MSAGTPHGRQRRLHHAWLIFAGTCVLSFVGFGLMVNTASIYWGPIKADLHVDLAPISLMSTIAGVAGAVVLGVAAPLLQRLDLKVFLSALVVLAAGAYFLSAVADSLATLYVANVVLGVSRAVVVILAVPVLLGNWFEKHLGVVMGIAAALTAVGGAVFSPLIGSIIQGQGWRTAYVVTGVILLVALLPVTIFAVTLRPTGDQTPLGFDRGHETATSSIALGGVPAARAFRSVPFVCFAVAGVAYQFDGSLIQHLPTFFTTTGLSLTVASSIYSLLLIGASIGKFAIGALMDRVRALVAIGAFTIIAVAGWAGLLLFRHEAPLATASLASGMAQAINLVPVPVLVRNVFGARDYSKILGPVLMVGSLANAAGVYVHGLIVEATGGYQLSFLLNIVNFLLAFAVLAVAGRGGTRLRERYGATGDERAREHGMEVTA